jgi:hypothetical protein
MRAIACLGLLALALPIHAGQTKFDPASRTRALAGLIEPETFALVRVDFTRIDGDALAKRVPDQGGKLKEFQSAFTRAGGRELIVSLSSEDLPGISFLAVPLSDAAGVQALTGLLKKHLPAGAVVHVRGSLLLAGSREAVERFTKAKPSARADLADAVRAAGDTAVQVILLPTAGQRRVFDEVVTLPVPGASTRVLTRGVRWLALGLDAGANSRGELTVQSADAAAARKLADLITAGVGVLGQMKFLGAEKPLKELLPKEFETATAALTPKVAGSRVSIQVSDTALRALGSLAQDITDRTGGAKVSADGKNLGQIVNAMHRYHEAHRSFPAHAIYSKEGKPLLSWRVDLLPYLDEGKLYREFKLDEPWDSPHNRKLIERIPAVYRSPKIRDRRAGLTTYLVPIDKAFIFTGTKEGMPIKEIHDGTSNTVMVVDANDDAGVVWTKPDDLVVSRKDPWRGLLGHYPGFVLVGTADGSWRRVARTVKPETLWAMFTRAGYEVLTDW